ncbi:hypothetical protein ACJX0J_028010, partial [Zea mays]
TICYVHRFSYGFVHDINSPEKNAPHEGLWARIEKRVNRALSSRWDKIRADTFIHVHMTVYINMFDSCAVTYVSLVIIINIFMCYCLFSVDQCHFSHLMLFQIDIKIMSRSKIKNGNQMETHSIIIGQPKEKVEKGDT